MKPLPPLIATWTRRVARVIMQRRWSVALILSPPLPETQRIPDILRAPRARLMIFREKNGRERKVWLMRHFIENNMPYKVPAPPPPPPYVVRIYRHLDVYSRGGRERAEWAAFFLWTFFWLEHGHLARALDLEKLRVDSFQKFFKWRRFRVREGSLKSSLLFLFRNENNEKKVQVLSWKLYPYEQWLKYSIDLKIILFRLWCNTFLA